MAFPWGSLITAGGSLLGGLLGKSGESDANRTNYKIAQENRDFQERMSSTAYQRSAKDLEEAGLNRILALGKPASTPPGNVATMKNENEMLANSVTAMARQIAEIKKIEAETESIQSNVGIKAPTNTVMTWLEKMLTTGEEKGKEIYDQITQQSVATAKEVVGNKKTKPLPKTEKPFIKKVKDFDINKISRQKSVKKDKEGYYVTFKGKTYRLTPKQRQTYIKTGMIPNG